MVGIVFKALLPRPPRKLKKNPGCLIWKNIGEKSTKLFKCMAGYCREEGNSQLSVSLEKRTGHKLPRQKPDLRKMVGDSF